MPNSAHLCRGAVRVGLLFLTLAVLPPASVRAEEPSLAQQVIDAHKAAKTYQAEVRVRMSQEQNRWTIIKEGTIHVAMDREKRALLIDNPDYRIVAKGERLWMSIPQLADRHLEAAAPEAFTYEALSDLPATRVVFMQALPQPDVLLLTAEKPFAALAGSDAAEPQATTARGQDGQEYPALTVTHQAGIFTMRLDPQTHLLKEVTLKFTVDPMQALEAAGSSGQIHWTFDIKPIDQPLPEQTFEFKTEGSTAFASVEELIQGRPNAAQNEQPGGQGGLPAIKLPLLDGGEFDIAQAGDDIIVLDFWATWCGPCARSLPAIQKVYDWAKEANKPVRIYAVNIGESAEEIQTFWKERNLSIPVLLDSESAVANSLSINAIPTTLIIHHGRVVNAHVGAEGDLEKMIKDDIESLLSKPQEDAPDEPVTPVE